jgi:CDP-diacylglycerol---serine O-phosphatidyltransferase
LKKIAIIPTLLTLGNAVCGFAAIACASKIDFTEATEHYFALSGWLIIAGMLCDAADGFVARLAKSSSKFGGELDSLCDAISFGLAPAFLLMRMGPGWEPRPFLHQLLAGIAALYMVCALLRLARYNVESTQDVGSGKYFRGLPSPGAAGCVASLAILRSGLVERWTLDPVLVRTGIEVWTTLGSLFIALLMVSRIPYPHATKQFLNQSLRGRRQFSHLVQLILAGFVIVMLREFALLLGFWAYALGVPAWYLLLRNLRGRRMTSPAGNVADDSSPRR